jgi:hypothetical protein
MQELHIIIFDEIDAICRQRGSVRDGTATHDTIVNQLLTKIDGVDALNNILLIGMTNRCEKHDVHTCLLWLRQQLMRCRQSSAWGGQACVTCSSAQVCKELCLLLMLSSADCLTLGACDSHLQEGHA